MRKTVIKYGALLLLFIAMSVVSSCKDDDKDSASPVVRVTKPISLDKFSRGGVILVDADLSDDKELATLEFSLASLKAVYGIDTPWTPAIQTQKLSGKEQQIKNVAAFGEIPYDIMSGQYVLTLKLSDKAGNTTSTSVTINID